MTRYLRQLFLCSYLFSANPPKDCQSQSPRILQFDTVSFLGESRCEDMMNTSLTPNMEVYDRRLTAWNCWSSTPLSKIIFSIVSSSSFPTLCCGFFVFGTPAPPVPPPMVNWWFRLVVYSCRNPVCKRILLGKWKENYSSSANRKDQLKPMNHFCSSNNRVVYSCPLMTP